MSDVKAPELPEGDSWKVEKNQYPSKGKSLRIIWYRRTAGGGGFHVAAEDYKPKDYRVGFQKVYEKGLVRLAEDADRLDRDAFERRCFAEAEAMAAGTARESVGTDHVEP